MCLFLPHYNPSVAFLGALQRTPVSSTERNWKRLSTSCPVVGTARKSNYACPPSGAHDSIWSLVTHGVVLQSLIVRFELRLLPPEYQKPPFNRPFRQSRYTVVIIWSRRKGTISIVAKILCNLIQKVIIKIKTHKHFDLNYNLKAGCQVH